MTIKKSSEITSTLTKDKVSSGRRDLIKKACYTAPAMVALGLLGKSQGAQAAFGLPPSLIPTGAPSSARQRRSSRG